MTITTTCSQPCSKAQGGVTVAQFDSIDEILDLAIEREIAANQLYKDLAKRMPNQTLKNLFEQLALEEQQHKEKIVFEIIKSGRTIDIKTKEAYLSMDDYDEDDASVVDLDFKDVFRMAIEKEKRALRFYLELAAIVDDRPSREVLLSLAEEEAAHRAQFETELERLSAGP